MQRNSEYDTRGITLESTLKEFGRPDFSATTYTKDYYSRNTTQASHGHLADLNKCKELTSDALRKYVSSNFGTFVQTSKEVATIESKMSRLASLLNVFKGSLSAVESTSFTHRDDVFMSLQKEAERIEAGRAGETRLELPTLEQLCEDLRALAYERKLGTAVALLEDALGRGDIISLNALYATGAGSYLAPTDVVRSYAHVPAATATSLATASSFVDRYAYQPPHPSVPETHENVPVTPLPGILATITTPTAAPSTLSQSPSASSNRSCLDPFANAPCIARDNPMIYGQGSRVADASVRAQRGLSCFPVGSSSASSQQFVGGIAATPIDPRLPLQRLAASALPVYGSVAATSSVSSSSSSSSSFSYNGNRNSTPKSMITTALPLSVFSAAAACATSAVSSPLVPGVATIRRTVARVIAYLVRLIVGELSSDTPSRVERKALTTYLIRLGHTKRALRLFLAHRSRLLHGEIRLARLVGGSEAFIHDLASLTFGVIAVTVKDVQSLFAHDIGLATSSCAAWAAQEVAMFARSFARHVFMLSDPIAELGTCLRVAASTAAEHSSKGLQLVPMLGRAIHSVAREALRRSFRLAETQAADALSRDDWSIGELFVTQGQAAQAPGVVSPTAVTSPPSTGRASPVASSAEPTAKDAAVRLTSSAQFFYDAVRQALPRLKVVIENDKQPQASIQMYPAVVASFMRLLDGYTLALQQVIRQSLNPHSEQQLSDEQLLAVLANINTVSTSVLPKLIRELQKYFRRTPSELLPYVDRAAKRRDTALELLCEFKALYWVRGQQWCKTSGKQSQAQDSILAWTKGSELTQRYSNSKPLPNDPHDTRIKISPHWFRLAGEFVRFELYAITAFGREGAGAIMSKLLEHVLVLIYGEVGWENFDPTLGGAQQLVLDMRWLLLVLKEHNTSKTEYFFWSLCRRITRVIVVPSNPNQTFALEHVLKPDNYYETVATNLSIGGKSGLLVATLPERSAREETKQPPPGNELVNLHTESKTAMPEQLSHKDTSVTSEVGLASPKSLPEAGSSDGSAHSSLSAGSTTQVGTPTKSFSLGDSLGRFFGRKK